jgi:hypothetical protein
MYGTINTYTMYLSPQRRELPGFYPETYATIPYVKPYISTYDIYFTDNYPRELLTYFLYDGGDPFTKHYTWVEKNTDFLSVIQSRTRGIMFVMWAIPENEFVADMIMLKYPTAKKTYINVTTDALTKPASILISVPTFDRL